MMRKLLLLSIGIGVLLCSGLALSGSSAATADTVLLRVTAPSIDGAVEFASSSGWTWRCASPVCSVTTARGNTLTMTATSGVASTFQLWGGACASSGAQPTCSIQVNDDQVDVSARFSRQRLWLPAFGPGTITVSPVPGAAPPAGRSCGSGCFDYSTGERLVLRGAAAGGYQLTAWGGSCGNVPADHGCIVTLDRSKVVSATFERIPSSDCPPGKSCDPIDVTTTFSVRVTGPGAVTAPKQGLTPALTCLSSGASGRSCTTDRAVDQTVAVTASGVRFRYWGGRCAGVRSTTCTFKNKHYSGAAAVITAVFG